MPKLKLKKQKLKKEVFKNDKIRYIDIFWEKKARKITNKDTNKLKIRKKLKNQVSKHAKIRYIRNFQNMLNFVVNRRLHQKTTEIRDKTENFSFQYKT